MKRFCWGKPAECYCSKLNNKGHQKGEQDQSENAFIDFTNQVIYDTRWQIKQTGINELWFCPADAEIRRRKTKLLNN